MQKEKLKIFIVNQYFPKDRLGGSELQCWLLAKNLPSLGHETAYIAVRNPEKNDKNREVDGVKIRYLNRADKFKLGGFWEFYKMLKYEKPDVCYIRIFRFAFLLSFACRFARVPAVFNTSTLRDCMPYIKGMFKLGWNPARLFKQLQFMAQRYLNFSSLRKMRVVTINKEHVRILNKRGIKARSIYNSMEDNYQASEKVNQVVWVNNIKNRKNPEAYLKLVEKFKDSRWKFLMIGYLQNEVEYYERLIKEARQVNPDFEYLGGLSPKEVDKILACSKIFVNTCDVEGFGNNFIQAWLAECPTITLSFDPDDIIKNNKLGFHSESQAQIEKDLEKLMNDNELRIEMGAKARKWAKENHDINNNKLKYDNFFKELIDEQKNK